MRANVKKIVSYLEDIAPESLAMPGDSVGLQLGNPEAEVNKVLISLDPDENTVKEALSIGAEMLVTHHPLFYHKLSSINEASPEGMVISSAIRNRISIFSAHTNFDSAIQGVSYQLAHKLGFSTEKADILEVTGSEELLKLVVFIPAGFEDRVLDALARAGAGVIGRYSHCTFQNSGTGTFMPGQGTRPYIGKSGRLEKVDEIRMETILPAHCKTNVIDALLKVHPYEEVAYDLYPLTLKGRDFGFGLTVELDDPLSLDHIIQICRDRLNANDLRYYAPKVKTYKKIAFCGGSGGSLIVNAARKNVELFISGDFSYHNLKTAQDLDMALVDAGHDKTEWPGVAYLKEYISGRLLSDGYQTGAFLHVPASLSWHHV